MVLGFVEGKPYSQIIEETSRELNVEKWKIERLVRTEAAFINNQAQLSAYYKSGIKYYKYLARIDERTSPECKEHNGKIYETEKAVAGDNFPPLHCYCRSVTQAVFLKPGEKVVDNQIVKSNKEKEEKKSDFKTNIDKENIDKISSEEDTGYLESRKRKEGKDYTIKGSYNGRFDNSKGSEYKSNKSENLGELKDSNTNHNNDKPNNSKPNKNNDDKVSGVLGGGDTKGSNSNGTNNENKESIISILRKTLFNPKYKYESNKKAEAAANNYISTNTFTINKGQKKHHKSGKPLENGKTLILSKDGKSESEIDKMLEEIANNYKGTGEKQISKGKWDHKEVITLSPEDVKKYNLCFESYINQNIKQGILLNLLFIMIVKYRFI
ncbi:MAG: minor capsid protein [Abditibacteriota bacterium]|nr:minor capsid protein [Abditibacteriota bacterium]